MRLLSLYINLSHIESKLLIKVKLTICGYFSGSVTLISVSLMLRNYNIIKNEQGYV